jgi:hypothetical protein
MRLARMLMVAALGTVTAQASDFVGIYGIITKVVFEPNADHPQRIQVFGVFSVAGNSNGTAYFPAQRGYLYFTLDGIPASRQKSAVDEWLDLRARGLESDTVWVIYGDHGEAFGQHEGNYAHTFFLYEENVHVPFLIAAEGMPAPRHVQKVVSLIDTAPTVLDLAGVPFPLSYQGQSMLPPQAHMALFYTDYSLKLLGVRDGPWKMIYEPGHRPKLFNLKLDAEERRDLASARPEQADWYPQAVLGKIR